MAKVKSITEAFSDKPKIKHLWVDPDDPNTFFYPGPGKPKSADSIEKIDLEVIHKDGTEAYVGYNFDGVERFRWLANSVNVEYE